VLQSWAHACNQQGVLCLQTADGPRSRASNIPYSRWRRHPSLQRHQKGGGCQTQLAGVEIGEGLGIHDSMRELAAPSQLTCCSNPSSKCGDGSAPGWKRRRRD
jgi:hypothetical protein